MHESEPSVNILMYHSISDGAGPTSISSRIFRRQMAALADCGYRATSLADVAAWARGEREIPKRSVVITFDDGYQDFATTAFSELQARGWTATVFLPAGMMGGVDDWQVPPRHASARQLMSWKTVAELARVGVDFGGHGVSHTDLTALPLATARDEIVYCKRLIEDAAGCCVTSFAPPYGKINGAVRSEISKHYLAAVGVHLAEVRRWSDVYNLPRIEMWYFRNEQQWRAYLQGGARGYFLLRKALRKIRHLAEAGHVHMVPVSYPLAGKER